MPGVTLPALDRISAGGATTAYRAAGSGPAVVLLHGLGGSSATWAGQYAAFAGRYRVVGWDMPGYGGSDNLAAGAPTSRDYAEALGGLLDSLGIGRAHIVGQSVAALIGAAFCATWPERALSYTFAHGLTGLGGLAPVEREKIKAARLEQFDALGPAGFAEQRGRGILGPATPPAIADRAVAIMAKVPAEGYHRATGMMASADFFRDAGSITMPRLVIHGGADPVSPEATCRAAAEALDGAVFRTLDDMGHYACMEDPALFNDCLGQFLDDVGKGS